MDKKVVEVLKKMASKIKEQDVLIKRLAQSNCQGAVQDVCKDFATDNDMRLACTSVSANGETVTVTGKYQKDKSHLLKSLKSLILMTLKDKCGFKSPSVVMDFEPA